MASGMGVSRRARNRSSEEANLDRSGRMARTARGCRSHSTRWPRHAAAYPPRRFLHARRAFATTNADSRWGRGRGAVGFESALEGGLEELLRRPRYTVVTPTGI